MEHTEEVSRPLEATGEPAEDSCTALVEAALRREPGIRGAVLNLSGRRLQVRYDPSRVSLPRLEGLARQIGLDLGQRYERCTRRLEASGCTECLESLRKRQEAGPSLIRTEANPAAATVVYESR